VPVFPNYAAGSEEPSSWHELFKIRGNMLTEVQESAVLHDSITTKNIGDTIAV
jgi:hypothetical protein